MTAVAIPTPIDEAIVALRSGVDGLLAGGLSGLTGLEVVELLDDLEVQRRRLDAVDAQLLAEVAERGIAGELGRTSPADVLTVRLHVAASEARARVRRAQELGPRRSVVGEPLAPLLPETSAAVAQGAISAGHASVIGQVLDAVPPHLPVETVAVCEQALVDASRQTDPVAVRRFGRMLLQRLDPDGPTPDEGMRRRGVTLASDGSGLTRLTGGMTAPHAAMWQVIFDVLAAPRPVVLADGREVPDDRSAAQRRHDAMEEVARRLLRSGALPDCGGVPATMLVTTSVDELARSGGVVRTAHGELIGAEQILSLAGELDVELCLTADADADTDADADVAPRRMRRLLNRLFPNRPSQGPVLAYGRTRRLATPALRKAVAARDGAGCCFPACTRPLAWTQANHIVRWEHGGRTDLDNLCLVCTHHHKLLEAGDWRVIMAADGRPSWIPPPWVHPRGEPIRNTAHHLPALDFDLGEAIAHAQRE